MPKRVLVPIADGTEELEAVGIIDTLRRAGAAVTVASVGNLQITASRGVRIVADVLIQDAAGEYDLVALPGGSVGAEHLRDSAPLVALLKRQQAEERLLGAICASPMVVLQHHGLIGGRRATCHPDFASQLENKEALESRVVVDGNLVTSRGPGTAVEFGLRLVALLYGEDRASEVGERMLAAGY
jgi:protein deglycase